ncbi:MAG: hypothetical protein WD628_02110, partial [Thermomicrobiales bacterium]
MMAQGQAPFPQRLYSRMLALYPRAFRQEYEEQIQQLVRDRLRHDWAGQSPGTLFWLALAVDLFRSAILERMEQLMTPSTVARYGGPLGMIGGLLWIIGWSIHGAGVTDNTEGIGLFALAAITGSLLTIATDPTLPGERLRVANVLLSVFGVVLLIGGLLTGLWWLAVGGIFAAVVATLLVGLRMLLSAWIQPAYAWGLI